jgi:protein-tyrosine phosphatase
MDDDGVARHRREETEFRLLYVCTGNICRSPFAEIFTRHLLVGRLGGRAAAAFDVSSAGVQAVVGSAIHPATREELAPWGLHRAGADRFVARPLGEAMISDAHLVLGANPRHRALVVERQPAALATSFTLREFARLAAEVDLAALPAEPVSRAHELVEQVRRRRGVSPPSLPDADRIPDPMGRSQEAHHEAAVLIEDAVTRIVDVIAPPLSRPRGLA